MTSRLQIDDNRYASAVAVVPAPNGCEWCVDPAASSDRMRLFGIPGLKSAPKGQVCIVYPNGDWHVEDPDPAQRHQFAAGGQAADLHAAMARALEVAAALGWSL